jgi:PBSX family phage portal protein
MNGNALTAPASSSETAIAVPESRISVETFSFGDAVGVLDRSSVLNYLEAWHNGRWYNPPVSMDGLARAFDLPGPHSSCIRLKVNLLTSVFEPTKLLSREQFRKTALDLVATGNCYLERADNMLGRPLELRHSLSRYTRRGIEEGSYFFVPGLRTEHEFKKNSICHLLIEHPTQELYGIPEFMGSLQSALLGEAATIFRRRYYLNGSHAGFVFYLNEATINQADADAIRQALKDAKGPGNFKNLFIHAPQGKKDGVQIIPIAEVAAKDEFAGIKNVSRDDVLAAHRTPPQLVGIVPLNNAGFGNVVDAKDVFFELEIAPLQARLLEVNDWLGAEAVKFRPYEKSGTGKPAPANDGGAGGQAA